MRSCSATRMIAPRLQSQTRANRRLHSSGNRTSALGYLFGVDFLWDPIAAMSIGAATGASFIREVVTGVYESDMGHLVAERR